MRLTDVQLAYMPRWSTERVTALPGRSRGDLLGAWGENLARRFGPDAVARVRRRLPPSLAQLAPILTSRDWLPVSAQLVLTEAIIDEFFDGDPRALRTPLIEDTRAGLNRVQLLAIRAMGPARAIKLGQRDFAKLHERGEVAIDVGDHRARLEFRGTPLFAHPTWRLLQLYATCTLLELSGRTGAAEGDDLDDDGFAVVVTWT